MPKNSTSTRVNLEEDVAQVAGIGILHSLVWGAAAGTLGFSTRIDPLTFVAAILPLVILHEGLHALPPSNVEHKA